MYTLTPDENILCSSLVKVLVVVHETLVQFGPLLDPVVILHCSVPIEHVAVAVNVYESYVLPEAVLVVGPTYAIDGADGGGTSVRAVVVADVVLPAPLVAVTFT